MTALQSFKEIYQSNRESKKEEYIGEEVVEIDFEKTNGKYIGENLIKLKNYIYMLAKNGYKFNHIAKLVDLSPSTISHHYLILNQTKSHENKFCNKNKK